MFARSSIYIAITLLLAQFNPMSALAYNQKPSAVRTSSSTGSLASETYHCYTPHKGMYGDFQIVGDTYKFTRPGATDDSGKYFVARNGSIVWTGYYGPLSRASSTTVSTRKFPNGKDGFTITYKTNGVSSSYTCEPGASF